ncbi:MAG: putative toxin-antitoxin system toxin component, PIN family [Kiritimatiellae bacterium]|nr:putative toxin-antitoxin system toxin component, PIN family [Kiritimatiellia bacterium]
MNRRVVLDTNCLLQSISRKGRYYRVWRAFLDGEYDLCITTDILEEYEEIIGRYTSPLVGRMLVEAILRASNTLRVDAHFRFGLIVSDPDDNKFVDCAIVANAECIVTNDLHFNELNSISFPRVVVKSIDEFLAELQASANPS